MNELNTVQNAPETRTIEVVTTEINVIFKQSQQVLLGYAIELGRRLEEAKQMLPHGSWSEWLKDSTEFSQSTANNFMRIYKEYGAAQQSIFGGEAKSQTLGNLPYTKALKLLAMPEEEREEFVETHDVDTMSTRELEAAIRERDEAKKQAEEYKSKLAGLEEQEKEADERAAEAESELEDLRRQLKELESAPTEVAVETVTVTDEEAVKAAAKEAKEAAEKRLKAKIEKAEREKARAEQEASAAKVEKEQALSVAEGEKAILSEQVQGLQKKLAVASSSEMTIFKLHFEQAQGSVNKMTECINAMKTNGDTVGAEKLTSALSALLRSTLEVLG